MTVPRSERGAEKRRALARWLARLDVDDTRAFVAALTSLCDKPADLCDLSDAQLRSVREHLKAAPRRRFEQAARVLRWAQLHSLHREHDFMALLAEVATEPRELAALGAESLLELQGSLPLPARARFDAALFRMTSRACLGRDCVERRRRSAPPAPRGSGSGTSKASDWSLEPGVSTPALRHLAQGEPSGCRLVTAPLLAFARLHVLHEFSGFLQLLAAAVTAPSQLAQLPGARLLELQLSLPARGRDRFNAALGPILTTAAAQQRDVGQRGRRHGQNGDGASTAAASKRADGGAQRARPELLVPRRSAAERGPPPVWRSAWRTHPGSEIGLTPPLRSESSRGCTRGFKQLVAKRLQARVQRAVGERDAVREALAAWSKERAHRGTWSALQARLRSAERGVESLQQELERVHQS